jgi:endogenous inhibitor of DNA gyrase (YacG/DUF329 family)
MQSEKITYDGYKWYRYYPTSERRSDRLYFKGLVDGELTYLHRYVWEKYNGPVPVGHFVHHIDGDPLNNAPDNLQAVTVEQHIREHWSEERSEAARQHASEIRVLASEWHRSPEGREWHRLHGKRAWANRKPIALICEQCGNGFETTKYTNARFCSNRCKAAWRRAAGIDDEFRTCPYCGERFSVNRYSKQRFCSRLCAQRHRFAPERACLQP